MGATGATHAKLWDDATGDYLDIEHIAKESRFALQPVFSRGLDGNLVKEGERAFLELLFFDDLDASLLIGWSKDQIKLNAVVFGIEDYIFWQEPATVLTGISKQFTKGGRNARWVRMSVEDEEIDVTSQPGYEVFELVNGSKNILGGFYSTDFDFSDGGTIYNLPPATFGAEGTTSWTIDGNTYTFSTVIFNTDD